MATLTNLYGDVRIDSRDLIERMEDLQEASRHRDLQPDEWAELWELEEIDSEGRIYSSDWRDGATLILDEYFTEFVQAEVEEFGFQIPTWVVVDWEATAENVQVDYTPITIGDYTYWVR
jgi:hypothetical protein